MSSKDKHLRLRRMLATLDDRVVTSIRYQNEGSEEDRITKIRFLFAIAQMRRQNKSSPEPTYD